MLKFKIFTIDQCQNLGKGKETSAHLTQNVTLPWYGSNKHLDFQFSSIKTTNVVKFVFFSKSNFCKLLTDFIFSLMD